jgi:hypothetical protein
MAPRASSRVRASCSSGTAAAYRPARCAPQALRFGLEDYYHVAVSDLSAVAYVFTAKFPCSSRDPMGERQSPDEYQAMGNLTYSPATKQFTYAWTTKTAWAGQCRVLVFVTKDGGIRPLLFDFR